MSSLPYLIDVEDVCEYLENDISPGKAELLVSVVSDEIREFLGQRVDFAFSDVTILHGHGDEVIGLPEFPVAGVSLVEVLADDDSAATPLVSMGSAGAEWRLELGHDARVGILRRLGGIWLYRRRYQVTYTHGYAIDQIPGTIRSVMLRAIARMHANPIGLRQESAGRASASYGTSSDKVLTDLDRRDLGKFQAPEVFT